MYPQRLLGESACACADRRLGCLEVSIWAQLYHAARDGLKSGRGYEQSSFGVAYNSCGETIIMDTIAGIIVTGATVEIFGQRTA